MKIINPEPILRNPKQSSNPKPKLIEKVQLIKEILSIIALFIGGAWVATTYARDNVLKPLNEPPHIIISSTLEKIGKKDSLIALKVTTNLHNTSNQQAKILSNYSYIEGIKVTNSSIDDSKYKESIKAQVVKNNFVLKRHYNISKEIVMNYGKVTQDEWFILYPEETYSDNFIFYVPSNKYDKLKFYVAYTFSKKDIESLNFQRKFSKLGYAYDEAYMNDMKTRVQDYCINLIKNKKPVDECPTRVNYTSSEISLWN